MSRGALLEVSLGVGASPQMKGTRIVELLVAPGQLTLGESYFRDFMFKSN